MPGVHVAAGVRASGADTFPSPAQHHVDLHVDEQGDDEGHVEGHDRGVDDEGRVRDDAQGIVGALCGSGGGGHGRGY